MALVLAISLCPLVPEAAFAVPSGGAPLPWKGPGPESCDAVCDRAWAFERMRAAMPGQVYLNLRRRIRAEADMADYRVTSGDVIVAMSYVQAGTPVVDFTKRIAQLPPGVDYPAIGHAERHEGRVYRFVRVAASGDWALIVDRVRPNTAARNNAGHIWPPHIGGADPLLRSAGSGSGGGLLLPTQPLSSTLAPQETPMPIPLPGTLVLLAGGVAALAGSRLLCPAARRQGAS